MLRAERELAIVPYRATWRALPAVVGSREALAEARKTLSGGNDRRNRRRVDGESQRFARRDSMAGKIGGVSASARTRTASNALMPDVYANRRPSRAGKRD